MEINNLQSHIVDHPLKSFLDSAAIIGNKFSVDHLSLLTGFDDESLHHALKIAEDHNLILSTESNGHYLFFHDEIRNSLLENIDPLTKKNLHMHLAHRLDGNDPNVISRLTYHLDAAGEYQIALPFALMAGELARQNYDLKSAENYFRMALKGLGDFTTDSLKKKVYDNLGEVLKEQNKSLEAIDILSLSFETCESEMDKAQTLFLLSELYLQIGNTSLSKAFAETGLKSIKTYIPGQSFSILLQLIILYIAVLLQHININVKLKKTDKEILRHRILHHLCSLYQDEGRIKASWSYYRYQWHSKRI